MSKVLVSQLTDLGKRIDGFEFSKGSKKYRWLKRLRFENLPYGYVVSIPLPIPEESIYLGNIRGSIIKTRVRDGRLWMQICPLDNETNCYVIDYPLLEFVVPCGRKKGAKVWRRVINICNT